MRNIIQEIIQLKLRILAQLYLKRYKTRIVAVTGNVGKSSAKEAIGVVLKSKFRTRVAAGNLNNEFGVPLTVLGDWSDQYYSQGGGILFWTKVLFIGFLNVFFGVKNYPEILVLEFGADRPGDIRKLARNFKPFIGVVTAVSEIPVHIEFFSGPEHLAKEKSRLLESLPPNGFAVINSDDEMVSDMRHETKAHIMDFGFNNSSNIWISNLDYFYDQEQRVNGISFKLNHRDGFVPVKIKGAVGRSQAYSAAAAANIGLAMGMNLVEISQALENYHGLPGRLKLLKGIKNSLIIDDSYNASPASTLLALENLKSISAKRKIAVLGDMLELGKYAIPAHQNIGNFAGSFIDVLIGVGSSAKFICDAAANQMDNKNIYAFQNSDDAKKKAQKLIEEGDLILIKGSQGIRTEKIVEEIMAEPEKKKELLVRQSKKWLSK